MRLSLPKKESNRSSSESRINSSLISGIHLFFTTVFFVALIYLSLFLFTKTDQKEITSKKRQRNRVYKVCAYVMAGCLLLIAIYFLI